MPDTLLAVLERDAAPVEGRPRPGASVAPAGPRRRWRGVRVLRRWRGVRVLRRWLRWRYGRIAPHGVALVGLYATFIALAHLLSFGRVERSLLLTLVVAFVSLVFLAMIALFAWTLWGALRDTVGWTAPTRGRRQILLFTAAAGLLLVLLPRLFSKDVLSYIMYGRAFGAYGLNPYTTDPVNVQFDYNFRLIDWHEAGSVYGPVWTLLCTGLYKALAPLASTHIWGYIVGFRLLALAFHLGTVALLWDILGRLRPRQQVAGTIFYAWNPLVLIEFAGNSHNDVALIFFLLAAVAAHVRKRPALVALFLALSVLTKFITLLIIPAYLLLLWREAPTTRARLLALGRAAAVGLATFALLWAPFRDALRHPLFLINSSAATSYDNSLLQVVYWLLRHLFALALPPERGDKVANLLVTIVSRGAFVALWALLTWRVRDTAGWLRAGLWILFAYLVLGTAWFWPWYVTWLVALAPLVGSRRATMATFTFSVSVLIFYVLWGNQLPFDRGSLYPLHNLVAFGLPLAVLWLQLHQPGAASEPVYAARRKRGVRNAEYGMTRT